ncbi:MAG TPA: DUF4835 family protein [Kaistella sp.]|uniref:type IX secretion system protein PorD n=1 Tax=Candidatus Kaistella beijingensis TaxID=2820270 RepID=UPI001CC75F24|nr:DUF4835 family protein [Candidatus Kaistella beijingensis]UBB88933.1 DUF4835 family protein [Candidatus Kaistella beijingensis]HOB23524.1 DUF4835 family protein [Kaistella sp.]HPZ25265.1 DUF4835 family protein [Kaistella sp.]HQD44146.1 DUF4835 family protein [Kaistella sp.]
MKKLFTIFVLIFSFNLNFSQELLATVQVNAQQLGGSNTQVFKTLEKNLRDFINNTSWTGKKLQNFEKIKCNFALVVNERTGNNFKGSLVVQAVRPVFGTTYETPLMNINDTNFGFEYLENENLTFNERQFSGKNLIDVISYYVYTILGYDGDSFKVQGGQPWFEKAQKISNNSMNQNFAGWSVMEGPKTRGALIDNMMKPEQNTLRNLYYTYHRAGLDNLGKQDQSSGKKIIFDALMQLKAYENNFQMNYPVNVFIDSKKQEIFDIFSTGNNANVNINDLKALFVILSPKDIDSKWNKWK